MLFRLIALWLCLMTTSLHTTGARAVAMTNGIEERTNVIDADSREEYRLSDKVGTPTEAYNAEGEEVWSRRLDMNGNILEENYDRYAPYSEQIRIPFLFQGQYYDHETELAYNRFRYYSPELSRYISEDPIRFASGTTALHSYVEDSNGWVDVSGLKRISYANPKATHKHHPLPKFLGGNKKQIFSVLRVDVHKEYHSLLGRKLKEHGLPLPDRGPKGSRKLWENYMSSTPGAQRKALDAVLETAREIDFKHGTDIVSKCWENIVTGNFKVYP